MPSRPRSVRSGKMRAGWELNRATRLEAMRPHNVPVYQLAQPLTGPRGFGWPCDATSKLLIESKSTPHRRRVRGNWRIQGHWPDRLGGRNWRSRRCSRGRRVNPEHGRICRPSDHTAVRSTHVAVAPPSEVISVVIVDAPQVIQPGKAVAGWRDDPRPIEKSNDLTGEVING